MKSKSEVYSVIRDNKTIGIFSTASNANDYVDDELNLIWDNIPYPVTAKTYPPAESQGIVSYIEIYPLGNEVQPYDRITTIYVQRFELNPTDH